MPQIQTDFEELPSFKDLEVGTVLEIIKVEMGKTQKQNFDCFTFTLSDDSQIFGTQAGVLYQLKQVDITSISREDPLRVRVTSYTDRKGNSSLSIKNAL